MCQAFLWSLEIHSLIEQRSSWGLKASWVGGQMLSSKHKTKYVEC